jgi:hypothetical protein
MVVGKGGKVKCRKGGRLRVGKGRFKGGWKKGKGRVRKVEGVSMFKATTIHPYPFSPPCLTHPLFHT